MSRFRVFATCHIGDPALQRLKREGCDVEVYPQPEPPPKQLILEKIESGVDGLITTLRDPLDRQVFEAGSGTLKVVAQIAVGFDNIDREAANEFRIPFTNTAEVLTDATAEFAFFILGCVARKLYPSEQEVREGRWEMWHPFLPFLGDEVTGKTVASIGAGRIGRSFLDKCTGFDMDLLFYDVFDAPDLVKTLQGLLDYRHSQGLAKRRRTVRQVSFEEALGSADFVSLHVPLTPETRGLMNRQAFQRMKKSAYLINTSRGPVVDEQALYEALLAEEIAGAALDVFQVEPLPMDSPLRSPRLEQRLRLFNHFASSGSATRLSADPEIGMAGRCAQGLLDVLVGNYGGDPSKMPYVVNKEAFTK